jgi:hypothetical protein
MPVLILAISENLDKLFKYGGLTTITTLGELRRVMVMAKDLAVVLVVTVGGTENSWAHRTSEMLYMVLPVKCCNVRSSQGPIAFEADQV